MSDEQKKADNEKIAKEQEVRNAAIKKQEQQQAKEDAAFVTKLKQMKESELIKQAEHYYSSYQQQNYRRISRESETEATRFLKLYNLAMSILTPRGWVMGEDQSGRAKLQHKLG
jgi:hypothetical protein